MHDLKRTKGKVEAVLEANLEREATRLVVVEQDYGGYQGAGANSHC